jgi:hypothetical protein
LVRIVREIGSRSGVVANASATTLQELATRFNFSSAREHCAMRRATTWN